MKIPSGARTVVTGGGSGFGRAISEALAARGARLLVTDIDERAAEETVLQIRSAGGEAHSLKVDVRKEDDIQAMAARAEAFWGGTDVLVNNAGVAVAGEIGAIPTEDWRWQIEINLMGVIYGCHHFVPKMRTQQRGWILNVASIAGVISAPLMGPYNVSKAGVIALSETLAVEARKDNVVVTALCPSFFRTNIHKTTRSHGTDPGTERLVTGSKWSAEQIAQHAIAGMDKGALYVMPQADAKAMWRAKRAFGQSLYGALGLANKRGLLTKLIARR